VRAPDFLIIGAAKCGTTSLASWLRAHPEVFVPADKELFFFDSNWDRGLEWYGQQFAEADPKQLIGEATPTYILSDETLDRIQRVAPDVKLIVCVREPVERAWSHYRHWRKKGEPRSFAEACAEELALGRPPAIVHWRRDRPAHYRYLAPGRFAAQLGPVAERFGRERIHVVFLEDLEADPAGAFAGVCAFLGVDAGVPPGRKENFATTLRPLWLYGILLRIRFGRWAPKWLGRWVFLRMHRPDADAAPMEPSLSAALREHFAAENAELAAWLDRPLPATWSLPAAMPAATGSAPSPAAARPR
jgi:hypothetical protein